MKNAMWLTALACLIVVMHGGAGDHVHTGAGAKGIVLTTPVKGK